jgi:malic enzyme
VNLPGGGVMRSSQANNMYVFPGLALGAFLGETGAVTDAMLAAAAEALPALIDPADSAEGAIYPKLSAIREISTQVAAAVMRAADSEGRVGSAPARAALAAGATALEAHIKNRMYNPVYKPLIRLPVGVME